MPAEGFHWCDEDSPSVSVAYRLIVFGTDNSADADAAVEFAAHGLHGRRRRFSSVSVSVVRAAMVPILVVPASGGSTGLSWA